MLVTYTLLLDLKTAVAINRCTKWLKAESKTKAIYKIYKHYTLRHVSFKRSLK